MQKEVGRDLLTEARTNWLETHRSTEAWREPGACRRRAHGVSSNVVSWLHRRRPQAYRIAGSFFSLATKAARRARRELGPALRVLLALTALALVLACVNRREPARRAICRARKGDRRQAGARCRAVTPHPAVSHRDARACGARRDGRTSHGAVGSRPARRLAAAIGLVSTRASTCACSCSGSPSGADRPVRRAGADSRIEQGRAHPGIRELRRRRLRGTPSRLTVHDVIVTCQIAMSLAMLISAALLVQSLRSLSSVDPGFRADRSAADLRRPAARPATTGRGSRASGATRSIASARFAASRASRWRGSCRWRPAVSGSRWSTRRPARRSRSTSISSVLGTSARSAFRSCVVASSASEDGKTSRPVVIVNERMAQMFWPEQDPHRQRAAQPVAPGSPRAGDRRRREGREVPRPAGGRRADVLRAGLSDDARPTR